MGGNLCKESCLGTSRDDEVKKKKNNISKNIKPESLEEWICCSPQIIYVSPRRSYGTNVSCSPSSLSASNTPRISSSKKRVSFRLPEESDIRTICYREEDSKEAEHPMGSDGTALCVSVV